MDAGFNQQAGPGSRRPLVNFGPSPPNPSPSPFPSPRPVVAQPRPSWSNVLMNHGAQPQRPRPPPSSNAVTSVVASRDENSVTLRISRSQPDSSRKFNPKWINPAIAGFHPSPGRANPMSQYAPPRTQVPEPVYRNAPSAQGFRPSSAGAGHVRHTVPPQTFSPQPAPISNQFVDGFYPSLNEARHVNPVVPPRPRSPELGFKFDQSGASFRPSGGASPVKNAPFPNSFDGRVSSQGNYANLPATHERPTVSPNTSGFGHERNQYDGVKAIEERRSAAPLSDLYTPLKRPSLAHSPDLGPSTNASFSTHDSQAPQRPVPRSSNIPPNNVARNPPSFPATKRSRSPPLLSSNQATKGNSDDVQDDEREMLAKAKRLARFKVELGEKGPSSTDAAEIRESTNWVAPPGGGRSNFITESNTELAEGFPSGSASSEYEVSGSSNVIVGLCTDMCPESERGERERKGDLDRFERLDGDRNQTSKSLAVKKYTRTAEREANLIRPMPVLQKTIAYLLDLLNKPYSDTFLATYNFLWDRMRAIRMDLRMQHIFNQGAITMLEQMIRLHILAMHELCEYSKGEGFTEGFDAHLNIEQMNKTSVELFQMYDDHRKKGIIVPSEKEFRGYYALLKLDKHPGYIVEPAELSLDLAKMTPEIRQTKEVLFARDVARACRTGNYIAFFRLARKASYLQACLMHAHFAKLRAQALASLHAGLQNNQGLPIMHVAEWLAMEEEDIVSLLEHHGFAIKDFDEPYLVKDGPFLNGDKDLDAKRSVLVDTKKSGLIYEDLLPSIEVKVNQINYKSVEKKSMAKPQKNIQIAQKKENESKDIPSADRKSSVHDIPLTESSSLKNVVDEHMDDFEVIPSEKGPEIMSTLPQKQEGDNHQPGSSSSFSWGFSMPHKAANPWVPSFENSHSSSFQKTVVSFEEERPLQAPKTVFPDSPGITPSNLVFDDPVSQEMVTESEEEAEPEVFLEEYENEDIVANDEQREETAKAKLKLMLRLWKRHSSRKKELREQKQSAANAALNSLSLGLPIQLKIDPPNISGEFDIDRALRERYRMHEKSWSRLNVSEEIADTLSRKNPDAECLCWKMILYSSVNKQDEVATVQGKSQSTDVAARLWLSSKLMPAQNDADDDDLIVSSPGLSIWKKRVSEKLCFSVVKSVSSEDPISVFAGASAVTFLACDSLPWNIQKAQLQRLITSIPSGSRLPLLILSGSCYNNTSDHSSIIVSELGLQDIDKSRINSLQIISLTENDQSEFSDGFFSDTQLREGLNWLASESSSQLVLQHVLTRDLVITHLNPSLERLCTMKDTEINPNDCVMAFNEAMDQSLLDVRAAAEANRPNWPCPEIFLLEEAGTLPESGWSSAEKIDPLMSALHNCRLPPFEDDFSYITKGSELGLEVEAQRTEFGRSLVRYLTKSTQLMSFSLAVNEAGIMLQSSRLDLIGSVFRIVPNWATIFRRIFNWRLTSSPTSASAYILQRPDGPRPGDVIRLPSHHLNRPSLSEMISCISPPEANRVAPLISPNGGAREDIGDCDMTEPGDWVDEDRGRDDGIRVRVKEGKRKEEADRLSELLEKCNILQNKIDAKLSVYS